MPVNNDIEIEFDDAERDYYVVWEPVFISSGKTRAAALNDLKQTAHFGIDSLVGLKIKDIDNGKEI